MSKQIGLCFAVVILLAACNQTASPALPTQVPAAATVMPTPTSEVAHSEQNEPAAPAAIPTEVSLDEPLNQETEMTLWHDWQGEAADALTTLAASYEAENQDVNVTLVYQANLVETMQTAVPAGEGPDIVLMTQDHLGRFAEDGLIVPVTNTFDTATISEYFTPGAAASVVWQDEIWGVPLLQYGIAIVYNKALVSQALLPQDPVDFDMLLTNAITYHEDHPDKFLLCNQSVSADSLDVYHAAPIIFGFGGPEETGYLDDKAQVHVMSPQRVAAAEWLLAFMEAAPAQAGHEICQEGFLSGEFAAWWTGPWALDTLDSSGIDYGVQPFGRPFIHVTGLYLGANASERNRETVATNFMAYATEPTVQTQLALAVETAPAHKEALQADAIQALAAVYGFGEAAANGIPFSLSPYTEAIWAPVGQAMQRILSREQTPEAALTEAQTAVTQAITTLKNQ